MVVWNRDIWYSMFWAERSIQFYCLVHYEKVLQTSVMCLHYFGGCMGRAAHGSVYLFKEMLTGCDDMFSFNACFMDWLERSIWIGRDKVGD